MRGKGPKKLNKFVPNELSAALHRGLGQVYRLYPIWSEAVGADLAKHSRPIGYADSCLTVQTDSPVWAAAIRQSQRRLIDDLKQHEELHRLNDLRVRITPTQMRIGPTEAYNRPATHVSAVAASSISRTAEGIEDKELKAALLRLGETTGNQSKR